MFTDSADQADVAQTESEDLQTGDDLAAAALSQAAATTPKAKAQAAAQAAGSDDDDEAKRSDEVAQTLTALQNVIERNALELQRLANELKELRETVKNVFENDNELAIAQEQVSVFAQQLKERKAKLDSNPVITQNKVKIGELTEQKKEVEEALSNHLLNYFQLTNSTSFDTSDGDQWEFTVHAKVKPKRIKKEDE